MPLVQAGEVRLEYFEAGEGSRTAVLVHGAASSARIWHSVQRELAEAGIRSFAIGTRGAGGSDHTDREADYTPAQYAQDLVAAVDSLGLERFTLVGHSLGTLVARYVARDVPERVQALVLMSGPDPAAPGRDPEEARRRAAAQASRPEAPTEEWRTLHAGLPADVQEALWDDIGKNPPQRAIGQAPPWPGLEGAAARIAVPVMVVTGDADEVVAPDVPVRGWLDLPREHRHLHVFHGVGHYPNAQVPTRLAVVLRRFIEASVPAE